MFDKDLSITRTMDAKLIYEILTEDSIWRATMDDGRPNRMEYAIPNPVNVLFLLPKLHGVPMGLLPVHFHNAVLAEIHLCLLPPFKGDIAQQAVKMGLQYVFDNTLAEKIVGMIPSFNPGAKAFSLKAGFVEQGKITKAWKRDNILYDLWVMGLEKGAV